MKRNDRNDKILHYRGLN
ncbi:TPA: hypothetical protein ACWSPE_001315 [Escherichia coli]